MSFFFRRESLLLIVGYCRAFSLTLSPLSSSNFFSMMETRDLSSHDPLESQTDLSGGTLKFPRPSIESSTSTVAARPLGMPPSEIANDSVPSKERCGGFQPM